MSLLLYLNVPLDYSQGYCTLCMFNAFFSVFLLIKNRFDVYSTFLSFGVIFVVVLLLSNYFYATFFYTNDPNLSIFQLAFAEDSINKSTSLSTIAIAVFCMASYENKKIALKKRITFNTLPELTITKKETVIVAALIMLYIFLGKGSLMSHKDDYSGQFEFGFRSYLKLAFVYLYYLIIKDVYNCRSADSFKSFLRKSNPIILSLSLLTILFFLLTGGRVVPLRVILLYLFCYTYFIKKISNVKIFIGAVSMAFILFLVGSLRNIWGDSEISQGTIAEVSDVKNVLYYVKDLVINSRSLYELVSYADKTGYTFGISMLQDILAVGPGFQSFVINLGVSRESLNSAMLVTSLYFHGDTYTIGLGTNIVGDVYVAFGLIGLIILFYFLGSFLKNLENKTYNGDFIACLLLVAFSMDVVFYTRNGYFAPLRNVVWIYIYYRIQFKQKFSKYIADNCNF